MLLRHSRLCDRIQLMAYAFNALRKTRFKRFIFYSTVYCQKTVKNIYYLALTLGKKYNNKKIKINKYKRFFCCCCHIVALNAYVGCVSKASGIHQRHLRGFPGLSRQEVETGYTVGTMTICSESKRRCRRQPLQHGPGLVIVDGYKIKT